jgi:hypothetical protein
MLKKFKNIISVLLVIIFILPTTAKVFDGLFHHHYHNKVADKNDTHFYQYHENCPIPGFELSVFSNTKQKLPIYKTNFYVEIINKNKSEFYCNNSKYSFFLRAPPIFTSNNTTS